MMVTSTPSPGSDGGYHHIQPPQRYHHHPGSGPGSLGPRRVPPEVPKRTSSISLRSLDHSSPAALTKTSDSGSVSSVQSSGSDSSNVMLIPPTTASTTWNKKPQVINISGKLSVIFLHDQQIFFGNCYDLLF